MSALSNTFWADFSNHLKEFLSFASWVVFLLGLDYYGSLVILRSASVRPIHLFDRKLQTMISSSNSLSRGSGMPIQVDDALVRAPCPVPSCPACEPNSGSVHPNLPAKAARVERGRHCYAIKWLPVLIYLLSAFTRGIDLRVMSPTTTLWARV